jgi:hypothetical protein
LVLAHAVPVQMWPSALLGPKFPILRVKERIDISLQRTNIRIACPFANAAAKTAEGSLKTPCVR